MTLFAGTFAPVRGAFGEPPSGLEGPGTIQIEPAQIVISGERRPMRTINVLSVIAGVFTLLCMPFAVVLLEGDVLDLSYVDARVVGLVCVAIPFGVYLATRFVLFRALSPVEFRVSLGFSFIVRTTIDARRVVLLTSSPDLSGLTAFETDHGPRFVEELEIARNGALPGYR